MIEIEIERKWLLDTFPDNEPRLALFDVCSSEQSYLSTNPEVRLIKHTKSNNDSTYKINIKTDGTIKRKEISISIDEHKYEEIIETMKLSPIHKNSKIYMADDRHKIIVSEVDKGKNSSFIYAEVEFNTEEDAMSYEFPIDALDVTFDNNYKMKNYWKTNR